MPMPLALPPRASSPRSAWRSIVEATTGSGNLASASQPHVIARPLLAHLLRTNNVETLLPGLAEARATLTPEQDKNLFDLKAVAPQANDVDGASIGDFLELAAISAEEALEAAEAAQDDTAPSLAHRALTLCMAAFGPHAEETATARQLCIQVSSKQTEAPETIAGTAAQTAVHVAAEGCERPPTPSRSNPEPENHKAIESLSALPTPPPTWDEEIQTAIRELVYPGAERVVLRPRIFRDTSLG